MISLEGYSKKEGLDRKDLEGSDGDFLEQRAEMEMGLQDSPLILTWGIFLKISLAAQMAGVKT